MSIESIAYGVKAKVAVEAPVLANGSVFKGGAI